MLNALIRFSLTQRLFVLLLVVLAAGLGTRAFLNLPIDAFPDVSTTQVKIIIKAPGMTPEEVEQRITAPVEVEMLGIPDQTMLRSMTKYGLTDITIDFAEGTDIYWARQQVSERLAAVWGSLPPDVSGGMAPITTPLGEMFMFTIEGGDLSLAERRSLLDWVIRPALRAVPGVAEVNSLGGFVRTFEVTPDVERMNARGVTFEQLSTVLASNNRNDGAGLIQDGEEALLVRVEGSVLNLDDLRATVVAMTPDGAPIHVQDVAEARIGSLTRYGAVTKNGEKEVVQGLVLGLRGANARELVAGVEDRLDELAASLPAGVSVEVFYNRGHLVERAVGTVTKALGEAIILVLILLVVFLANLRAAITVALILPLAALVTFILMDLIGMSANLMSLGGLAIAIGMLVDAAVVVVENIVARLAEEKTPPRQPRLHVIYRAVREVATPVTAGILIIVIVFLPLLTLEGLEGKLFKPVAITIVFALGGSLLLSLTAIPVLSSYLLRNVPHGDPWLVRQLHKVYTPSLAWSLRHPLIVGAAALLALVATAAAYTQIGKAFMPTLNEGDLVLQLEKLPSISLDRSIAIDKRIEQALMERVPEITSVVARTGSDELGLDPMGLNEADGFLTLKPRDQWRFETKEELIDAMREVLDDFPGIAHTFTQPIEMRVSEMLTGVRGDLAIKLFGPDLDVLNAKAQAITEAVRGVNGASDVFYSRNEGVQYLKVSIDREAAGRQGMSIDTLETLLRAQLEGQRVGTVYEGMRRTPLMIRGSREVAHSSEAMRELPISLPNGRVLPLSALAAVERVEGPVMVERELGDRFVVVAANVTGRDLVGFVEDARRAVAEQVDLEAGYRLAWGGQFENQQRAAKRLGLVVPISVGLIFLLLFSTFGSLRQATLVLLNIPFALIGGVFGLWISGEYLSVPASVGFIALLGIAVLNGVVLVTYFNQLRALGLSLHDTVIEGARRRLRPVLMTASIAAFALIPLLFATGPGSEIQRPLAAVVIGGLVTSTLLTLILLPILYRRFGEPDSPSATDPEATI
ncbi:MAG: CusA/CzcA family heavy metal efflux RND transporter [Halothiobacillaceae bacterium]